MGQARGALVDLVGGYQADELRAQSEGQGDVMVDVAVTDDVGAHLTGHTGQGDGLGPGGHQGAYPLVGDVKAGGGDVVAHGLDGGAQVGDQVPQVGDGLVRVLLLVGAGVLAQGAQEEAELVKGVGGGALQGGELLTGRGGEGGVGGGDEGSRSLRYSWGG